jgi:protocatechuate 3,4-dioxygenase, alpha subunit
MRWPLTPSQTVGPFFAVGLPWPDGPAATADDDPLAIWLRGRVYDGAGEPVADALVETWQADPAPDDRFRGFARCPTDAAGAWAVRTRKPGAVPGEDGAPQAPHVAVSVFARGLLDRVVTRLYFADEPAANAADPILAALDPDRAAALVAAATPDGYALDIHFQGPHETVFFSI